MDGRTETYLEQREHKRYLVCGIAVIESESMKVIGRVVSIGGGGMLVYCDLGARTGEKVHLSFSLAECDETHSVIAQGRVVWTQPGRVGVEFIEEPIGLGKLLLHLEEREQITSLS